jgi:hypothetical protein
MLHNDKKSIREELKPQAPVAVRKKPVPEISTFGETNEQSNQ